jgi:hypothetical protein
VNDQDQNGQHHCAEDAKEARQQQSLDAFSPAVFFNASEQWL